MALSMLFYSCSNQDTLEPSIVEEVYELNLYQDSYSAYGYSIHWSDKTISLEYSIDGGSPYSVGSPESGIKAFTDKNPGLREEIIIDASGPNKDVRDTILVYTSPLDAVTWEDNSISSSSDENTLNIVTNHDISDLDFYVAELGSQDLNNPPSLNESNGTPSEDSWDNLNEHEDRFTNLTDEKPRDAYYAYTVKYTDSNGNYRFSTIEADIGISSNFKESSELVISATTKQKNRIYISWNSYTGDDFYSYQVWRSNTENFSTSDDNAEMLLEVSDSSVNRFEDRRGIGSGTWYYRVVLKNIFGKESTSSIEMGRAGM